MLGYPEIPETTVFDINPPFSLSSGGTQFVQYDNEREDRIIIFGSVETLAFLQESNHWFMDGTFSTVPHQFLQLYSIHGIQRETNVVGLYCLLTNKRRDSYVEILQQVKRLTNERMPQSVMTDFEQAMISALGQEYPLVPRSGCLFHLSKNVYRKVQELGLSQRYVNNEDFRTNIKMITALAFVPVEDIIESFQMLADQCGDEEEAVLDYFESAYVGELRRGRRLQPTFPHELWSMHVRVEQNLPRTNNALEGWHNRFSSSIQHPHPHIWKFIGKLKEDNSLNIMSIVHNIMGVERQRKRKYAEVNERVQNLVRRFQEMGRLDFLRGISYNLV